MKDRLNIPVGISDFKKIRENGYYYIDKTGLVEEILKTPATKVTLITRPRRFGKTLNMSMTEYFFSVNYSDAGKYFKGLSIWKNDRLRKMQGTYPVISISFADIKATTYESARRSIIRKIVRLYSAFDFVRSVLKTARVHESEKEKKIWLSFIVPKTEQYYMTSLAIVPLQLMGYYVSVAKGLDVDKPRNLAKSVTVE